MAAMQFPGKSIAAVGRSYTSRVPSPYNDINPDYSWASVASGIKGMSGAGFATKGRAGVADTTLSTPPE